ncbi:TetR family transcriptional regulator [Nocardioides marmoriginsengisoli]|uniref:TetR family transcriptional regulator n=1 Tax=Nocardioides marmoriginsengisoli TaxID=661483 RepID=A0A3N0CGX6_9ACTN|nr:TetR family transcriptional regulator [Nocardioides marmoriginsengisoli]
MASRSRSSHRARPTDNALLDGARDAFATHGFYGASMETIADAPAAPNPTLYSHFA